MSASQHEIEQFMQWAFPDHTLHIESVGPEQATLRHRVDTTHLRPGNTVSGPTQMALADAAIYVAIHATLGLTPLAVTSNLNINFLRRPAADRDLIATCRLLKVGRLLVVGEVLIQSDGDERLVAQVTGTYVLPASTT